MDHFLYQLAHYYYHKYGADISDTCFVFPGRRAGLFFQKYLSEIALADKGPIWSPRITTINELFEELSDLQCVDEINALIILYKTFEEVLPSGKSFDEFFHWGQMLLNDFDDIDKYLVNPHQLFLNLASIKELEDDFSYLTKEQIEAIQTFWKSFNPTSLSEFQGDFLKVWEALDEVYRLFKKKLAKENLAIEGTLYRLVADRIKQKESLALPYNRIVFAAFNALNECEKELFRYLKNTDKADFFWDYSDTMMQQEVIPFPGSNSKQKNWIHEAGLFIAPNRLQFPSPSDWVLPKIKHLPPIEITSVASDTAQTQEMYQILEKSEFDPLKTAVVLADENLLMPVIHAIPEKFDQINVTMGYPLSNTPVAGLTDLLYKLQRNSRTTKEGKTWFYHRDVLPILSHQYLNSSSASEKCKELVRYFVASNKIFIEAKELHKHPLLKHIFHKLDTSKQLAEYLLSLFHQFYQSMTGTENSLNLLHKEFIYQHYLAVKRLDDIIIEQTIDITPDTWLKLYRQIAEVLTIPFQGEPLNGLQVMGLMETRALDFDNLIVLSMNEGIFPQGAPANSFIPYNLRKGFGLPTIEHQDAIFAYYFYRLIHRAKSIKFLFNSSSQGLRTGEMSRFLYQLKYEFPQEKIEISTSVEEVNILSAQRISAPKDSSTMERLMKYCEKDGQSLSPSSLSHYLECPLRFFYKNIAKIKEPEEITEEIDPRIFGNIFHELAEQLYKPYIGKQITASDIEKIAADKTQIDRLLLKAFHKHFGFSAMDNLEFRDLQGRNILIFEIIKKYLHRFLKHEKTLTPFSIIALEQKVTFPYKINKDLQVNLGGIVDRIDEIKGKKRVVDYKTGSGDANFQDIKEVFASKLHKKKKPIFQTFLYCMMLNKTDDQFRSPNPAVIWVKDLYNSKYENDITFGRGAKKTPVGFMDFSVEYEQLLNEQLSDLFNPDIDFYQTEDEESCRVCSYKGLCRR